jgi:uncharacterized membrane protein
MKKDKIRLIAIMMVSLLVMITGILFSVLSFIKANIMGGITGALITIMILIFAISIFKRGNEDLKKGYPLKDERSIKVLEKASSKAFYVSLYLLLAVGFLSEYIPFRDVSQATSMVVGGMALLFAIFWVYYNGKEL